MSKDGAGSGAKRLVFKTKEEKTVRLPKQGGMPESVHIFDDESILAVNAALGAQRPLLVRGEPGTGKSQLARAAAAKLGRSLVQLSVDSRTESQDLLWSVDSVARLAEAQVMGALIGTENVLLDDMGAPEKPKTTQDRVREQMNVLNFVRPGVLWWAFDWKSAEEQAKQVKVQPPETPEGWSPADGVVVLIDEIDKADASVPNGLLDAFGHGRFDVPGRTKPVSKDEPSTEPPVKEKSPEPLVIITTNEERSLPDAFLRRCLVLHLGLPDNEIQLTETLVTRGKAHFPSCADAVLTKAASLIVGDRKKCRDAGIAAPGLAEYLDLLRAVTNQPDTNAQIQENLLDAVAPFTFRKHPESKA